MHRSPQMLTATAVGALLLMTAAPVAAASRAGVASTGAINGFASGDFVYLNALQNTAANNSLAQVSVSQSAAAVSSATLTASDSLDQLLFSGPTAGKDAYGHAAGVSLNLGQGAKTAPQARLTSADAASPPPTKKSTNIVTVPAAPVLTATVQPDDAQANTSSQSDFCVLGKPLSQGTADVADAQLFPADTVAKGFALADVTGEVLDQSTQQLTPNGLPGRFGLSSSSTLHTAGVTLFKGVSGAETTIKVLNPITLDAVATGVPGSAKLTFGDAKGNTPVLSVSNGSTTQTLNLSDLIGGGAVIDFDGLLKVHIGLAPTKTISPDGTKVSAVADLVSIQFVDKPAASSGNVGGPLGTVLNPVLGPVMSALDSSGLLQQIDGALRAGGLTKGADFRLGHFETTAQVPPKGVSCGLNVHKNVSTHLVHPGDSFTYTITVSNPYDCTLTHVKIVDTVSSTAGVSWQVVSSHPTADIATATRIVWDDIGDIASGHSKSVTVGVSIDKASASGTFTDHAVGTASCGTAGAAGGVAVLTGQDTLHAPKVQAPKVQARSLPNTGSSPWIGGVAAILLAAGLIGVALRRRIG